MPPRAHDPDGRDAGATRQEGRDGNDDHPRRASAGPRAAVRAGGRRPGRRGDDSRDRAGSGEPRGRRRHRRARSAAHSGPGQRAHPRSRRARKGDGPRPRPPGCGWRGAEPRSAPVVWKRISFWRKEPCRPARWSTGAAHGRLRHVRVEYPTPTAGRCARGRPGLRGRRDARGGGAEMAISAWQGYPGPWTRCRSPYSWSGRSSAPHPSRPACRQPRRILGTWPFDRARVRPGLGPTIPCTAATSPYGAPATSRAVSTRACRRPGGRRARPSWAGRSTGARHRPPRIARAPRPAFQRCPRRLARARRDPAARRRGAAIAHIPEQPAPGSGIATVRLMRALGLRVGIGTDSTRRPAPSTCSRPCGWRPTSPACRRSRPSGGSPRTRRWRWRRRKRGRPRHGRPYRVPHPRPRRRHRLPRPRLHRLRAAQRRPPAARCARRAARPSRK